MNYEDIQDKESIEKKQLQKKSNNTFHDDSEPRKTKTPSKALIPRKTKTPHKVL